MAFTESFEVAGCKDKNFFTGTCFSSESTFQILQDLYVETFTQQIKAYIPGKLHFNSEMSTAPSESLGLVNILTHALCFFLRYQQ